MGDKKWDYNTGVALSEHQLLHNLLFSDVLHQYTRIVAYTNKDNIPNQDSVIALTRINIPFLCDCLDGEVLAHSFPYKVKSGDSYDSMAKNYSDLKKRE
ncbi:hypothetical protein RND71_019274 [Anisodus tanguticus]|uniref:Uncharacterized protein n=1 Tax=Anisodus tanguticus TaxID=243964 RepID=A0AAE1V998_9SOLA|nr:hypothetical protein RND71_019274 [Anisodus tanguticus]